MKRPATAKVHEADPVEGELAELEEGCAWVLLLLQRRDCSDILGKLSAIVLHLHAHTRGLDELIDDLKSD